VADYARRVWDNSGDDNIFFLAGGIAFNILLAAVPFFLLLLSGLGYLLHQDAAESSASLWRFIDGLLPPHEESPDAPLHRLLNDIIGARRGVGIYSLIGFVWFSTRLFGSLRTVLGEVFDIEQGRSIVGGKLFDIAMTIVATVLFAAYTTLVSYLQLATSHTARAAAQLGFRRDLVGTAEYWLGLSLALLFIFLMFFALYKYLPDRRIHWRACALASLFTTAMFELARRLFTAYIGSFNPGSLYTGTLYAVVIIVFWVYYAGLIFIIGGEVGQVYQLRRTRRMQRETFVS
jgi:membrane protein